MLQNQLGGNLDRDLQIEEETQSGITENGHLLQVIQQSVVQVSEQSLRLQARMEAFEDDFRTLRSGLASLGHPNQPQSDVVLAPPPPLVASGSDRNPGAAPPATPRQSNPPPLPVPGVEAEPQSHCPAKDPCLVKAPPLPKNSSGVDPVMKILLENQLGGNLSRDLRIEKDYMYKYKDDGVRN